MRTLQERNRGGVTHLNPIQMAIALQKGLQVVISKRLDPYAILALEDKLSELTGSLVCVIKVSAHHEARFAMTYQAENSLDLQALCGHWQPIDLNRLEVTSYA